MPEETKDWKPVDTPGEWIGDGLMVGVEGRPRGHTRTLRWAATVRRRDDQGCSLEEAHAVARIMRAAKELAEALEATVEHVAVPAAERDDAWRQQGAEVLAAAQAALRSAGRLP